MPCIQPAPAVPGNRAPIQQTPSLRRPPPANVPRTPRPINGRRRDAKVPYPELPETPHSSCGRISHAEFRRACFLRALAGWRAGQQVIRAHYRRKTQDLATSMFLLEAEGVARRTAREDFNSWMESCGGMAGPGFVAQ
ncbi:MAG: hypothetical protein J7605_02650 [Variovorax sp.]|nr:hypothetical protein [Variovorax sp.]